MSPSRYTLHDEFAAGGMASVHYGFVTGQAGFSRVVAIKKMHAHVARDPRLAAMFADEARLAARVRHPNVVSTLDVVASDAELLVVMEYVAGESLAQLLRLSAARDEPLPLGVVSAIFVGALDGLHAAHEAKSEHGASLGIVHRDVSPQNLLVGADGVARVLDFGIAKAEGRVATTIDGQVKGKLAYMAPEHLARAATRASDVYSAGICLWEALTLRRLFDGANPSVVVAKVTAGIVPRPSEYEPVPQAIEEVVMRALARDAADRYATADAMARALEAAVAPAPASAVARWVDGLVGAKLRERAARIAELERERAAARAEAAAPEGAPEAPRDEVERAMAAPHDETKRAPAAPHDAAPERAPRPRARAGAGVAVALVAACAAAIAARARATRVEAAAAPAVSGSAPSAAETAAPPRTEPSAAAPTPDAPSVAPPSRPRAPGIGAPHHLRGPRAPRPGPVEATDCDPPYAVDEAGVRHYKRACFK